MRLRLMVIGDREHNVDLGSGPLDGGKTLRPARLILMSMGVKELIYHKIVMAKTLKV